MAVIMQQVMPEGVTLQMIDEASDEMGVDENPPEGLLIHAHFESDGQVQIVDMWETAEAYEAFRDDRLTAAMAAVMARHGASEPPAGEPDYTITPVHRVVRGG